MAGQHREILAQIGQLAVSGQLPQDPNDLLELLLAQGFERDEVSAVLGLSEGGSDKQHSASVRMAHLSEDATRFMNVLRAVGYLDDHTEEHVLDLAMAENSGDISLDEVRRHVAAVMFDRQFEMDPETLRLLEEEWRLVFH